MEFIEYGSFQLPSVYLEPAALPSPEGTPELCRAIVLEDAYRANNAYFERRRKPRSEVTIKRITADQVSLDREAKQVYREVNLLKQMHHENIAKLLDVFTAPRGDLYVVIENEECNLQRILTPEFAWEEGHPTYILYGLLRGLKYLHSAGIIHRDIKPENILLDQSLTCRITNFSSSRPMDPAGLKTGYVTTRFYRAPEVLMTWQSYSKALDIWGAGCVFAEMLNRMRGCITLTADDEHGNKRPHYCLFPATTHVDHLVKLVQVLGPPDAAVLARISDEYVTKFVLSKVRELEGQMTTLGDYFADQTPEAIELLQLMLKYDSHSRISAEKALTHSYLSAYHDPEDEPVRTPVGRRFESQQLSAAEWRGMIDAEINDMATIKHDGSLFGEDSPMPDISIPGFEQPMTFDHLQDLELDPSMIANIPALGQSAGFDQVQQLKAKQEALVAQLDVLEPGADFDQLSRDLAEVSFEMSLATGQLNLDDLLPMQTE
eukprot:m.40934 g.40934  ORF g.40934 m.40934 type:complete len:490 (+) comp12790_c0_seq1:79-1548(+)